MIDLEFDKEDIEKIREYLKKWDDQGIGNRIGDRPDGTSDAIYLVPLTITLLKRVSEMDKKLDALIEKHN